MYSGLTSTRDFGFSAPSLTHVLRKTRSGTVTTFSGNAELAQEVGIGIIQLEALGAWMRLAGLTERGPEGLRLTDLGAAVCAHDSSLTDPATWWVLHWRLASSYVVWNVMGGMGQSGHSIDEIDEAIRELAPESSDRTIKNARTALVRALEETPLGQELGLVRLEYEGDRVTALTKLPVRHGQAPMAAVAYALIEWARREDMSSAALESLGAPNGPGPALHMSEGAIERYLIEIDGASRGRVLSYSRTAGLNEVYFKQDVTPLQVLVSHYIQSANGCPWTEALDQAQREVDDRNGSDKR